MLRFAGGLTCRGKIEHQSLPSVLIAVESFDVA
jgi:hypothetical protein